MRISKFLVSDMNESLKQDIINFVETFELSYRLAESTFLITGSTGLIGSILIHSLIALNRDIHIIAPVRNVEKGKDLFDDDELKWIRFVECDLTSYDYSDIHDVNYIIHCAAPTSSKFFVEYPVETFNVIYQATYRLLEYARSKAIKSFVYLSSLEVYGTIMDDSSLVTEDVQGYVNPMEVRSSYPMAKRAAENLCCLYAKEYGVNVKVARLTQTTGAGVSDNDNRVIVQFCRLAAQGNDIVLHSRGNSARPYCYTMDAISAILYILLKGFCGHAYNVANEDSYISAKDLALYIQKNFNPDISVKHKISYDMGYAQETRLRLSTKKLHSLGWENKYSLYQILDNLIKSIQYGPSL